MENKLTDNEIVKALEYCSQQGSMSECERCKIKRGCRFELIKLAFDLINRLQAKLDEAEDTIQFADKELKKAEAEVERLQNSIAVFTNNAVDFANEIDRHKKDKEEAFLFAANIVESEKIVIANAKAEAYKECIEKVKEKSKKTQIVCTGAVITIGYSISHKNLEILLKELVGEDIERLEKRINESKDKKQ